MQFGITFTFLEAPNCKDIFTFTFLAVLDYNKFYFHFLGSLKWQAKLYFHFSCARNLNFVICLVSSLYFCSWLVMWSFGEWLGIDLDYVILTGGSHSQSQKANYSNEVLLWPKNCVLSFKCWFDVWGLWKWNMKLIWWKITQMCVKVHTVKRHLVSKIWNMLKVI